MDHIIGIDVGTQGTKAVLFDEKGAALASAFRKSCILRPDKDAIEEDPECQFNAVCDTIAECMSKSGAAASSVAAVAIDGQMAGIIGVGADGKHITPYDSWLDSRCAEQIQTMQKEAGDEIIKKTGGPVSVNHGPKILWWKKNRPDIFKRIASFVQPGGYCAMRLCGLSAAEAFIDASYLHFSGFADNAHDRWDASLCKTFGIDPSKLPRIVAPQARIGGLTAAAAQRCKLTNGTALIAGCGDTAASFLAAGATRPGVCVDVAGTASVFASTTTAFRPDTKHRMLGWGRSATPGLWHPYAYVSGGGMNLEWFRSMFAIPPQKALSLQDLDNSAAALPWNEEIPWFVPHLNGRVCPSQPFMRGAWMGLTGTHTSAHLYRSVLEAVALEYTIFLDVLRELNPELNISELRITGGGEKSAIWNQIKADVLNARVVQIVQSEGAPRGAAMVAALGAGLITDLKAAAAQWTHTGAVTEPQAERTQYYANRLINYRSLLDLIVKWRNQ
ncbi:MAG: FGGY family carbohydrate kinase [Chitinivibrionales bacterium]|nr:FGGY family carbohydrate kinase [Chitinivibrionales bacterium]